MGVFHTAHACYKCMCLWQSFRVNNFAEFQYSEGKKIRVHPVIGGVSLKQHLLLKRKLEIGMKKSMSL